MASQREVDRIFSSVASRYDVMNSIMSFGLHKLWKSELVRRVVRSQGSLVDVAGGTGDIAVEVLKKKPSFDVTLCDINFDMLNIGRNRALDLGIAKLKWVCCGAACLPFSARTFDYYTIAFGIRNVPDRDKALKEAHRVLKHQGRFLCLEFSPLTYGGLFSTVYNFYSFKVIPTIGGIVARDRSAYLYLVDSIRAFPSKYNFSREIQNAGFSHITYHSMCNGVVTLYSAWKI